MVHACLTCSGGHIALSLAVAAEVKNSVKVYTEEYNLWYTIIKFDNLSRQVYVYEI